MEQKKLFAILYLYTVASNQLQTISTFEISLPTSSFAKRFWKNGTMHVNLQYEILMKFERRKSILLKNLKRDEVYTDLYVIQTNDTRRLKYIAGKHGFTLIRKVFKDEDYYLLKRSNIGRYRRSTDTLFRKLKKSSEIRWTARQILKDRVQRSLFPNHETGDARIFSGRLFLRKSSKKPPIILPEFNDPLFKEQWYLHNSGQTGTVPENDINVLPVWRSGISGRGVAIAVLDDGVFRKSEEVADNYDVTSSEEYLYLNTKHRPIPENSHGTYCAAIAAGVANNSVCGVGVAYEARIGGVRILDGPLTDVQEALALVHALDHVDIYTASWGPNDDGRHMDGPGFLTRIAFLKGVTKGRQGKGSIYVWAAGNGGAYLDNCALDGYASSPFTLTIGALTEEGRSAFYSEPCAAVIASVYVGGSFHTPPSLMRSLMEKTKIKVVVPEGRGKCRDTFQGTSAAAPMAAGVVALALQANPDLTWRDIQHIVIRTSRVPLTDEDGWVVNAAGFSFHSKLGSGVLDADALVELGRTWKTVGPLYVWTSQASTKKRMLLPGKDAYIRLLVLKSDMLPTQRVDRLETVVVTVSIQHSRCGDLRLVLESPSGTPSTILTNRPHDNETTSFKYWDFVSIQFWGEDPKGRWTLRIANGDRSAGFLDYFSITLYGTGH